MRWDLSDAGSPSEKARAYEAARGYRFRLADLNKYSQTLKAEDTKWRFDRSVIGKAVPRDEARLKRLQREAYVARLQELKEATDWAETPIYHMYERYGRWVHTDPKIYSDVECK
jgi:hypothetical protein